MRYNSLLINALQHITKQNYTITSYYELFVVCSVSISVVKPNKPMARFISYPYSYFGFKCSSYALHHYTTQSTPDQSKIVR